MSIRFASIYLAGIFSILAVSGAAAAKGEYYKGVTPAQAAEKQSMPMRHGKTFGYPTKRPTTPRISSGDYYEGVTRPK